MRAIDELADDDSPFGAQRFQDDADRSDSGCLIRRINNGPRI